MNIVILDGYTLNPGDLSWGALEGLGRLTVYERTAPDDVVNRCREADILLTNKTPVTAEAISSLPRLRYIGVIATGYNIVDVRAARDAGIPVCNVPGYGTSSVAQHVFALLLELCSHVGCHDVAVHRGQWTNSPDFSFTVSPLSELYGKTMGIIGLGDIGRATAKIANAFGMRVLYYSRTVKRIEAGADIERRELPDLLAGCDVISLHCPLTAETERLIRRETMARMKPDALLINTSRGGLIDESDLAHALHDGSIAGCGLDVLSSEPPLASNPLLTAPNCIITPHIAWASREARGNLLDITAENIRAYMAGSPIHQI